MPPPAHTPDTTGSWPDLSIVQQWFQSVVTHPEGIASGMGSQQALDLVPMSRDDLEHMVTRSEKVSAQDRLAIYANAYYARLIECLGESYPVMKRTLGEEAFNGFCFDYLQHYPSTSYTLGRMGEHFAQYLNETRPDAKEPSIGWPDLLIDLAHLEWSILQIFDGPGIEGVPTLQAEDLKNIQPEQWTSVRLNTVPCLDLLALHFPLNEFYTLSRQKPGEEQVPMPSPLNSYMAITRRDYIVRRHELTQVQYTMLVALQEGKSLGEALEAAATHSDLDDESLSNELQQWFHQWINHQFFESITL